jgi:predicted acylesterase/phospholipase RssA
MQPPPAIHVSIGCGGVLGMGLLGACEVLAKRGVFQQAKCVGGMSVGGILALLVTMKSNLKALRTELIEKDWSMYRDTLDPFSIYDKCGLLAGNRIMQTVQQHAGIPYTYTFADHYKQTGKRLVIGAYNLTEKKMEFFDHVSAPNLSVLKAVRMGIGVPYLFAPTVHNDNIYIDGAIKYNTPLRYMRHLDPTALHVVVKVRKTHQPCTPLELNLYNYSCMLARAVVAVDDRVDGDVDIAINTFEYGSFDFNLVKEQRELLHRLGTIAAKACVRDDTSQLFGYRYAEVAMENTST